MKDDGNEIRRSEMLKIHPGPRGAEPYATIEAIERKLDELGECDIEGSLASSLRAMLRFWGRAIGPCEPVPPDAAFAELVDFIEQEGPEHVDALLILFQRAVWADQEIFAAALRLASHVWDLGSQAPGSTGEAHRVSVDLDCLTTQVDGAGPAEALGPSPSPTRDLLAMARTRQAQGECPGWVVARLRAAVEDE